MMMSVPKILAQLQLGNSANAVIYTVPANTKTKVTKIVYFNNNSGGAKTAHLACKKSGGTARKLDQQSINDNTALEKVADYMLGAADEVQSWASAATAVDCTVFGIEYPFV